VDVLRYDRSRVLEVKPHGVNKGLAATAILESLWIMHEKKNAAAAAAAGGNISAPTTPLASATLDAAASSSLSPRSALSSFHPMVLAIGDDRSDEDMFQAIQQKLYLDGRVRGRER
jgi:trehalose-6-phosphatase